MLVGSTLTQFNAMLRRHSALIVHFSGLPRGSGATSYFPNDLEYALANAATCRLACSTVRPGDIFGPVPSKNATGSVGLVLAPRTNDSVLDVWHTDGGSFRMRIVRDVTLQECEGTITGRIGYNEWALTDYEVLGLFAIAPQQVDGLVPIGDPYGGTIQTPGPVDVDLAALPTKLARLPIFTFANGLIDRVSSPIAHDALYP